MYRMPFLLDKKVVSQYINEFIPMRNLSNVQTAPLLLDKKVISQYINGFIPRRNLSNV
jgi:hypothetical protein